MKTRAPTHEGKKGSAEAPTTRNEVMYHRLAAVHHAAKADAFASARMLPRAAGHRARARWHAGFGRRQRFGSGAPRGSELYNAEQLAESLSDPTTHELFVDPVFVSSGHTFERSAIADWLSTHTTCPKTRMPITSVLVPNHHARSMVEEFVAAYATREGDEWAEIRVACADRETRRRERPPELARARRAARAPQPPPEYTNEASEDDEPDALSEDEAVAYVLARAASDPYVPTASQGFDDAFVRDNLLNRGMTRRQLDHRYDEYWQTGN